MKCDCLVGPRFPPVPIWTEKVNNDSDLLVNVTFIAQPQPNVIWTHLAIGQHENLFPIRQDHIKYRTKLYHDKVQYKYFTILKSTAPFSVLHLCILTTLLFANRMTCTSPHL